MMAIEPSKFSEFESLVVQQPREICIGRSAKRYERYPLLVETKRGITVFEALVKIVDCLYACTVHDSKLG
jgi:hypothetical protein